MTIDVRPHLATAHLARVLEVHETLGSTNDRARELARAGAVHGTTVVAEAQTHGRGQRGRTWHSPPGAGLYVSFLVRPALVPAQAPLLPLLAGVALHDAVTTATGLAVEIKWPNDLLVRTGRRKLAGILVEVSADPTRLDHAVIGIGINLLNVARPPALAAYATALESELPLLQQPSPGQLLAALAGTLEARLQQAEKDGLAAIVATWNARAAGLGEPVEVRVDDHIHPGILRGVDPKGQLRLETTDGERNFHRGELRLPNAPDRPEE